MEVKIVGLSFSCWYFGRYKNPNNLKWQNFQVTWTSGNQNIKRKKGEIYFLFFFLPKVKTSFFFCSSRDYPLSYVSYVIIIIIIIMLSFLLFGGSVISAAEFPFYYFVSFSFWQESGDHLSTVPEFLSNSWI